MDAATRTHIRMRRSEILHAHFRRSGRPPIEIDFEKEVEDALAHFHRTGPWPPEVHVPKVALSAIVNA